MAVGKRRAKFGAANRTVFVSSLIVVVQYGLPDWLLRKRPPNCCKALCCCLYL